MTQNNTTLPNLADLLGPVLRRISFEQRPLVIAAAERAAAKRYRGWASQVTETAIKAGLLECAAREDEIARRIEGLFSNAGALQMELLKQTPELTEAGGSIFAPLSLEDQFRVQATGERIGAGTWRAYADKAQEPAQKETFLRCAHLEEESATYLEELLARENGKVEGFMNLEKALHLEGADGRYRTELLRDWEVWGPNGGYLASLALRAAGMQAEIKRPSSLYCHFLSSPQFAVVELEVDVLKRGRRSESISVCMKQNDKPVLQALIRTAAAADGYTHQQVSAPTSPPPEALKTWEQLVPNHDGPRYKFWENLESRPLDQRVGENRKSDLAQRQEWIRFVPQASFDDPFVDAARALILLDTYGYPAAWDRYGDVYIAPNLDTSMWFHASGRSSDWLLIDHACPVARDGLVFASGNVWDREGKLIANGSAHLCCLPMPKR